MLFRLICYLFLIQSQLPMHHVKEQPKPSESISLGLLKHSIPSTDPTAHETIGINPYLCFQKNYPKNLFIPMIQHLAEIGLRTQYEHLVGSRQVFEGKNVVSLAQIQMVVSQPWFSRKVLLEAMISNMSCKILLNSKIKKKLFHLLLIPELFSHRAADPKEFKKQLSRRAGEISKEKLQTDELFAYPNVIIYLLGVFYSKVKGEQLNNGQYHRVSNILGQSRHYFYQENNRERDKSRELSSKEQYKSYLTGIITLFNNANLRFSDLFDTFASIRSEILAKQAEIKSKYPFLPASLPGFNSFIEFVIEPCFQERRKGCRLTFSLLNGWIANYRHRMTTYLGWIQQQKEKKCIFKREIIIEEIQKFTPIVLVKSNWTQ